jgi:outer membrane protein assembly factor BamB
MSLTGPSYPPPQRNRTSAVLTISILVAFFLLIGLSWMGFAVQSGLLALSTPTVTATPLAATRTPTPDIRATNVAGDMLTQVVFAATAIMQLTPQTPLPIPVDAPPVDLQPVEPGESPQQSVQLPLVSAAEPQPTSPLQPDATSAEALTATAVFLPSVAFPENPTPTGTPIFLELPTPLPTEPDVIPPTETPTPPFIEQPTPTPTLFFVQVNTLSATTRASADTAVYIGPSTFYSQTEGVLAPNTPIQLSGRTQAGDWLFGCCINNTQAFWVRPAYLTIANNPVPAAFPQGVDLNNPQWDPNNPKWLPIRPLDGSLTPRPRPTSVPIGDYPLARYDRGNTGRLPMLPRSPVQDGWGNTVQAGAPFRSPVAVMEQNVLSSNDDGQLYSLNRNVGSQRWRYNLSNTGNLAPAINEGLIYFPYAGNRMVVLQDGGNFANPVSDIDLPGNITTSPTFLNDAVFVGAGESGDARLVAMKRDNLGDRRTFDDPQSRLLQPAIGQEVIYVAADRIWAVDINFWRGIEIVWESSNIGSVAAPPVYAYPGVIRPAELYVTDASGVLHALDANTGASIWTYSFGSQQSMLAVNDTNVFAAGGGILRSLSRQTGQILWTMQIGDNLAGGPFVTSDRVLVITQNGSALSYDATNGAIVDTVTVFRSALNAAPAVSQEWLFAPSFGAVYGYRGNP